MEITYAAIKHLVMEESISGSMLVCKFKVPGTSTVLLSSVSALDFQGNRSRMVATARREGKNVLMNYAMLFLQRIFGSQVGWSAGRIVDQGLNGSTDNVYLSAAEKERAVMKAFEMIAAQLDCVDGKWTLKNEDRR